MSCTPCPVWAAACAAAGKFDAARNTAKAAIDAATAREQSTVTIKKHLKRYQADQGVIDRSLEPG